MGFGPRFGENTKKRKSGFFLKVKQANIKLKAPCVLATVKLQGHRPLPPWTDNQPFFWLTTPPLAGEPHINFPIVPRCRTLHVGLNEFSELESGALGPLANLRTFTMVGCGADSFTVAADAFKNNQLLARNSNANDFLTL